MNHTHTHTLQGFLDQIGKGKERNKVNIWVTRSGGSDWKNKNKSEEQLRYRGKSFENKREKVNTTTNCKW